MKSQRDDFYFANRIILQISSDKTDPVLQNTNMQLKLKEVVFTGRCFNSNLENQIHPSRPHLIVVSIENFVSQEKTRTQQIKRSSYFTDIL